MSVETTYSSLRENLASYLDQVIDDREIVIVRRRGERNVAILPLDELAGILETAHLLRSPKNAERLIRALNRSLKNEGTPMTVDELRRSVGLNADNVKGYAKAG